MKLLGYKIGNDVIGKDLLTWDFESLGNNDPVKIIENNESIPSGYEDISNNLMYWKNIGLEFSNDYLQFRDYVLEILNTKTWSNLSNEERDYCIELHIKEDLVDVSTDGTNKVTHLIMTGQAVDPVSAKAIIIKKWAHHHILEKESCSLRANSEKLYEVVATYLTIADATDFFLTTENLYIAYESQAIKGTQDGSFEEGLFDYIESTVGTSYEFGGLNSKGYIMQTGDPDETNFINALMEVLRKGNY